jgi:hypothetical protein
MADIIDEKDAGRFAVDEDGYVAQLVYRLDGDRLVLEHTAVPGELGGRGIGGRLVRAALTRAAEEHLTLVPECSYARKWLEDHPDERAGVTVDWP